MSHNETDVRMLYLDLIERCLLNTIYADLWPEVILARPEGHPWPSVAHTMLLRPRMANLRQLAELILHDEVPGDFMETGVWRGGACIYMRAILRAHGVTDRRVIVADSFEGLPPPNPDKYPVDAGNQLYTFRDLAVSLEQVKSNFAGYGLLDSQVVFLKGWFSQTLPSAPVEQLALLRLDGDLYESTMDALVNLYDKVSPGGFIIIDDYEDLPTAQQAVTDFRTSRMVTEPMSKVEDGAVFWRKSASKRSGLDKARGDREASRVVH